MGTGIYLILSGMLKKVVVADYVAINLVDRVFENHLYTGAETLVALYGYTVQIYCDFSGYSDVAIGTGMLMGYRLPDNFDRRTIRFSSGVLEKMAYDPEYLAPGLPLLSPWRFSKRGDADVRQSLFNSVLDRDLAWGIVGFRPVRAHPCLSSRSPSDLDETMARPKDAVDPWMKRIGKIALMFHYLSFLESCFGHPIWIPQGESPTASSGGTYSLDNVTIGVCRHWWSYVSALDPQVLERGSEVSCGEVSPLVDCGGHCHCGCSDYGSRDLGSCPVHLLRILGESLNQEQENEHHLALRSLRWISILLGCSGDNRVLGPGDGAFSTVGGGRPHSILWPFGCEVELS